MKEKINAFKVEQLKGFLRERQLPSTGSRDQLVQRLSEYEQADEIDVPDVGANDQPGEATTVKQLQLEMRQLRDMMAQLLQAQHIGTSTSTTSTADTQVVQNAALLAATNDRAVAVNNSAVTSNDSAIVTNDSAATHICANEYVGANMNTRHASVKEIANTLPEFDPTNDESITVDQFIDRVNKVVDAYQWEDKFLLLAIYTRLKGVARMWVDASPILHTTWADFSSALRGEFGSIHDEAEIHYVMASASRRTKETIREYCFRMSALGIRYNLSEGAIIRYARSGLKHRELQQNIAAMKFTTMKQMRDAIEDYLINRGGMYETKLETAAHRDDKAKQGDTTKQSITRGQPKCYNCNEPGHFSNKCPLPQRRHRCTTCNKVHPNNENCNKGATMLRRLGATNLDKCFSKTIYVNSQPYTAFIDTGSQCSIIRKSVAESINAERSKCLMQIRGICGGVRILNESMILKIEVDATTITTQVYIADDELVQQDFLLGQDVIINANISMKIEHGCVVFENKRAIQQTVTKYPCAKFSKLLSNFSNAAEKAKMHHLLENFTDVFSNGLNGIGKTDVVVAHIELENNQAISQAPYRIPEPKRDIVNRVIDELLQHDIITKSTSEYASPVVLIKKRNGSERLCVDYRRLNKQIKKENFPVPNIEERLQEAKRFQYFSSLDLNSGYYQIAMSPQSMKYTAFITTDGLYEFKPMPFGLKNAPAVFNSLMAEIHKRVEKGDMLHYMDDILIGSNSFSEMYEKLARILHVLRSCGLTLNLSKCEIYKQTITFLGHELHPAGISPGDVKTNAIANFPQPTNVTEVRQFLGLSGYFRKFVAGYAIISEPLRRLLRKDSEFNWGSQQDLAFNDLKQQLISKPTMVSYRIDAEHELHTDASSIGLASVLMQIENGQPQPIAYYSRSTTKNEKKFHSYELEALAVVESLERFKYYIYGKKVKVITDCSALRTTMEKRELIPRIARWWLRIQEFDIEICHRSGARMEHVDALSRAPYEEARELDSADMKINKTIIDKADWLFSIQLQDANIKRIISEMQNETKPEYNDYTIELGRLYRKCNNKLLWVVPKQLRYHILQECHDKAGHMSVDKTVERILNLFWFPRLRNYTKGYIKSCVGCALNKQPGGRQEGQYHYDDIRPIPFATIHIDHLGPFPKSSKRNEHILVIVDSFTKFAIIRAVKSTATQHVIPVLSEVTSYVGMPERIISDRGTAFTSKAFHKFCQDNGVKHVLNAVRTPRANGHAERTNRIILSMLLPSTDDDRHWDDKLRQIQWSINTMINKTTKCTPCQLLYGYTPRDILQNKLIQVLQDANPEMMTNSELQQLRADTANRINDVRAQAKIRYDARHATPKVYTQGDLVLATSESVSTGTSRKLEPRYKGPFIVSKVLSNDRYVIEDLPHAQRTQRHYKTIFSSDQLKPWCQIPPDDDDSPLEISSEGATKSQESRL